MLLEELLNENDRMQQQAEQLKQVAQVIVRDCQSYINSFDSIDQIRSDSLYRGMSTNETFVERRTRKKRKPQDMPEQIHHFVDKWFNQQFGVYARSRGLFVTSGKRQASRYGIPYYVFPVGQFKIIGSTHVEDLYEYLGKEFNNHPDRNKKEGRFEEIKNPTKQQLQIIEQLLEQAGYQQYSSPQQWDKGRIGIEATVITDSYYAVNASLDVHATDYFFEQLENIAQNQG